MRCFALIARIFSCQVPVSPGRQASAPIWHPPFITAGWGVPSKISSFVIHSGGFPWVAPAGLHRLWPATPTSTEGSVIENAAGLSRLSRLCDPGFQRIGVCGGSSGPGLPLPARCPGWQGKAKRFRVFRCLDSLVFFLPCPPAGTPNSREGRYSLAVIDPAKGRTRCLAPMPAITTGLHTTLPAARRDLSPASPFPAPRATG